MMAKATTMVGSAAMTDMWESQYSTSAVVLMPVIAKC
jgi:hypothetical protein